ncbi:zinc-binding dehydrogenase [Microbispora sp. CA-102843]|uniref:zinc-binding dehydrogenase n=1 Tax=Microbispora sp. CA-102843 TaxID=3239952 RepID=UPI003D903E93
MSIADHPLPDVPGAVKSYVQEDQEQLAHLASLIERGELRLRVAHRYPFHQVRAAHERFASSCSPSEVSARPPSVRTVESGRRGLRCRSCDDLPLPEERQRSAGASGAGRPTAVVPGGALPRQPKAVVPGLTTPRNAATSTITQIR